MRGRGRGAAAPVSSSQASGRTGGESGETAAAPAHTSRPRPCLRPGRLRLASVESRGELAPPLDQGTRPPTDTGTGGGLKSASSIVRAMVAGLAQAVGAASAARRRHGDAPGRHRPRSRRRTPGHARVGPFDEAAILLCQLSGVRLDRAREWGRGPAGAPLSPVAADEVPLEGAPAGRPPAGPCARWSARRRARRAQCGAPAVPGRGAGGRHRPTGRWVAFGSAARCRRVGRVGRALKAMSRSARPSRPG